ncbi:FecR family protein [Chitinophaga pinensis]|uniref:Anti-FecI sigma factor, FecR n=1 Tax=Chitinophaga pinensis (strain ATCC 43595 / DSM 2588 / LMG 13176 / NBRC 15968 / NCIMB 11800 / UQM 2034) TaxID=485918 RepID=A0A979GT25_CHIPD|nr:FecR domain-containing protein [Chitinophaga pinensis]ACU59601.1 anti-FecI sigma factor, FecR [Chitinophaga pinensis DSM 2588]
MEERIAYLLGQHRQGVLTAAERQELQYWLDLPDDTTIDAIAVLMEQEAVTAEPLDESTLHERVARIVSVDKGATEKTAIVRRLRTWWWAAAVLILCFSLLGIYRWQYNQTAVSDRLAQQSDPVIMPGSNKAVLTLANGEKVNLDSTGHQLIREGETAVQQQGGSLLYAAGAGTAVTYNTLATPRGGQFQLVLADGTIVWLNAASSIRYPTAFNGDTRQVEVSGEAYFQVATDPGRPFTVHTAGQTIAVLGTQFNINNYGDNGHIITTLLAGKIRIDNGRRQVELAPGEQSIVHTADISINKEVDTDMVIAWKNGLFKFNGTKLEDVMKQLSRWYDVDVIYEGAVPERHFSGEITRGAAITEVLDMLRLLHVNFKITDNGPRKTITVVPD